MKNRSWITTAENLFRLKLTEDMWNGEIAHRRFDAFFKLEELHIIKEVSNKEYNSLCEMLESSDSGNLTVVEEILKLKFKQYDSENTTTTRR